MPGSMQYDSAAMQNAMKTLQDAYNKLTKMQSDVDSLKDVVPPGRSDYTGQFHQALVNTNNAFRANHQARLKEITDALTELVAIDKAYNNSELVNKLTLQKFDKAESKG
ncbi:hypothetical protein [Sciscionella marina]|uniref:hypothetical protein n=1 Tax=Sciscionella marina TaxID=508770 RepID=UPI0012F6DE59|nr:hypothetical protein [Sciscionella marina]